MSSVFKSKSNDFCITDSLQNADCFFVSRKKVISTHGNKGSAAPTASQTVPLRFSCRVGMAQQI